MRSVTVTVRLFAMLRERAGRDVIELELASGATVADALEALRDADDLGELLERMPIRAAVNREYVSAEMPLASGDELALIPPVSGGAAPARGGSDMHASHR
jgi:molybdopterin converting factor subunit 1